jgi:site-specific DNA-cytosine methylase
VKVASLCAGIGGADLALEALGHDIAWHAEIDPDASAVLAHHWPDVPNVGDIKAADWGSVEPVDALVAGYPCQPFSMAGQRKGEDDPRHLWPAVRDAVVELRPHYVFLENVPGHVTKGLLSVLGDLASLGFDAEWGVLGSHHVGGCHRRDRLWVAAADAGRSPLGQEPVPVAGGGGAVVARLDRTAAAVTPLLPTPTSRDDKGANQRQDATCLHGALLPTPTTADGKGGPGNQGRDGGANLGTAALADFGRYQAARRPVGLSLRPATGPDRAEHEGRTAPARPVLGVDDGPPRRLGDRPCRPRRRPALHRQRHPTPGRRRRLVDAACPPRRPPDGGGVVSRTTRRVARVRHRCTSCLRRIIPGEVYLEHVCSPDHDGLGNKGWWRLAECAECATRHGRGAALTAVAS